VLALARGLPALTSLRLSSHISSLGRLGLAAAAGGGRAPPRGITDAGLAAVATHCTALRSLAVTGGWPAGWLVAAAVCLCGWAEG
jgi:hypothetical protein